jgi:serine/threonine protein kinase
MMKKSEVVRLKQVEHIKNEKEILTNVSHPFIVTMCVPATGARAPCAAVAGRRRPLTRSRTPPRILRRARVPRRYGVFQDERNLYMVLEFVPGGELFTHLRKAGKFTNDQTRFYAAQIVMAIQCLHTEGVVYRDLKPENLLLDDEGYLKIADFGFAKYVEDRTWTLCGTPEYLAPEIIQSKGHGKAVDWWALGILVYEMLSGYPPFYDENPFGIYQKILANKLEFPRHFEMHARDLVRKLLFADRTKRIGNLKNGAEDIKKHKWFRGLNWAALYNKQIPAPIVPEIDGPADTRQYDKYADSTEESGPLLQVRRRTRARPALNARARSHVAWQDGTLRPTHPLARAASRSRSRVRTSSSLETGDDRRVAQRRAPTQGARWRF